MITDGDLCYCVNAMLEQYEESSEHFAILVNLKDATKFRLMSTPRHEQGYHYPEDGTWFVVGLFDQDTVENALRMYHMHYVGQRVRAIFGERSGPSNDLPK